MSFSNQPLGYMWVNKKISWTTILTFCWCSYRESPLRNGIYSKRKEFAPQRANPFPSEYRSLLPSKMRRSETELLPLQVFWFLLNMTMNMLIMFSLWPKTNYAILLQGVVTVSNNIPFFLIVQLLFNYLCNWVIRKLETTWSVSKENLPHFYTSIHC